MDKRFVPLMSKGSALAVFCSACSVFPVQGEEVSQDL